MVEVLDYDPRWPETFQQLRDRLWPVVKGLATAIEHVGSTAVPGLAAKPTIDIIIVLKREGDLDAVHPSVVQLGYTYDGPSGQGRAAYRHPEGAPSHHLFACEPNSMALRNPIAFRDYLRQHPAEAARYGELKKRLAKQAGGDHRAYADGKTTFIMNALRKSGFRQEELETVSSTNTQIRPADTAT